MPIWASPFWFNGAGFEGGVGTLLPPGVTPGTVISLSLFELE